MAAANSPAQLGADNVIRFVDVAHFLRELAGNLGRGRAFVRTRRSFDLRTTIDVEIEAPSVDRRVTGRAVVVFNRDGFLGLEFEDFDAALRGDLDTLGRAAETVLALPPNEQTEVASVDQVLPSTAPAGFVRPEPSLPTPVEPPAVPPVDPRVGGAQIHFDESDDGQAGSFVRAPGLASPSVTPPPLRARRRPLAGVWRDEPPEEPPETPAIPRRRRPVVDDLLTTDGPPAVPPVEPPESDEVDTRLASDLELADPAFGVETETAEAPRVAPLDGAGADPIAIQTLRGAGALSADLHRADGHSAGATDLTPGLGPAAPSTTSDPLRADERSALADPRWALTRMTASGVLRITDPSVLLGLYLSEVRHGTLTAHGGPDVPEGESVRINIEVGAHWMAELCATVVARVGPWLTLAIVDPSPLEALLRESHRDWLSALAPLGAPPPPPEATSERSAAAPPDASTPPPPVADPAPAAVTGPEQLRLDPPVADDAPAPPASSLPVALTSSAANREIGKETGDLVEAIVSAAREEDDEPARADAASTPPPNAEDTAEPSAPPAEEATPEAAAQARPAGATGDARTAKPPRLEGDLVIFEDRDDLAHEMAVNLNNGGLFVISEPLDIRSKRRLQVSVGDDHLPVVLETDVVFADGGRVGFSVANTPGAQRDLQRYLDGALPLEPEPNHTPDLASPKTGGLTTTDVDALNKDSVGSADLQTFSGTIVEAPDRPALLELQETRVSDPAQLSQVSVLHLFEYAIRRQWKGVLTIKQGEQACKIWMHEGSVAFIISDPYDEATSLGRILVTQKKLTEPGLREALDKSKQHDRSLGRSLVLLGAVKRTDITAALREQVRLKMDACFAWSSGRYDWTPWTEPPGQADLVLTRGIGVMARHVRGRVDHVTINDLEGMFGRGLTRTVAHAANVDTIATSLQLTPRDLRFLELQVDGTKTVTDAVHGSALGRLASLRLIAIGLALGFVKYVDEPVPRAPTPTRSDTAAALDRKLKRQLEDDLKLALSQNHFDRLGVHWSAHHRTYRAAFERAVEAVDLTKPPLRDCPDDVKSVARQLRAALDESFKALNDAQQRATYRKQLFDKTEREYAADMLVKQGEVALMRGDRVQAIECLETAVELSSTQRYRALLTHAREGRS